MRLLFFGVRVLGLQLGFSFMQQGQQFPRVMRIRLQGIALHGLPQALRFGLIRQIRRINLWAEIVPAFRLQKCG